MRLRLHGSATAASSNSFGGDEDDLVTTPPDGRGTRDAPLLFLVDDDADIRDTLGEILTDAGYGVVSARNGVEAIAMLRELQPCLILVDLYMPVMDGFAFCEARRRDAKMAAIPTIVMSAMDRMHERVAELGVDAALEKPVELQRLLDVVGRYCRRSVKGGRS